MLGDSDVTDISEESSLARFWRKLTSSPKLTLAAVALVLFVVGFIAVSTFSARPAAAQLATTTSLVQTEAHSDALASKQLNAVDAMDIEAAAVHDDEEEDAEGASEEEGSFRNDVYPSTVATTTLVKQPEYGRFDTRIVDPKMTYGEIARSLASQSYSMLEKEVSSLNENVQPQDVYMLRKSLMNLKYILQLFQAAYFPTAEGVTTAAAGSGSVSKLAATLAGGRRAAKDLWLAVAKHIDHGYTVLGEFQDLSKLGLEVPAQLVAQHRAACLAWSQQLTHFEGAVNIGDYVRNASPRRMYVSPNRKLSAFFWGTNPSLRPQESLSGLQNIAMLVSAMLDDALVREQEVLRIASILDVETHEAFHNLRKRLRVLRMVTGVYLPQVFVQTPQARALAARQIKQMQQIVVFFGDLNDEFNAYAFLRKQAEIANGIPSSSSSSSGSATAAARPSGSAAAKLQHNAGDAVASSKAASGGGGGTSSLSDDAAKACAADEKGKQVDARFRAFQREQREGGPLSLIPVVAALKSILIKF